MNGGIMTQESRSARTSSTCQPAAQRLGLKVEKLHSTHPGQWMLSVVRTCCLLGGCGFLVAAASQVRAQETSRSIEAPTVQASPEDTAKAAPSFLDNESRQVDAEAKQDTDGNGNDAKSSDESAPNKVGIRISKQTTYLTEPLDSDGFLDVIGALNKRYGKGATAGNNSAVVIWSIALPESLQPELVDGFYERLGIPVPADPQYVSLQAASKLEKVSEGEFPRIYDQQGRPQGPWTEKEYPELGRWVRLNEESLKKLHLAIQKPRYYVPLHVEAETPAANIPAIAGLLLPDIQSLRDFARLLQASAGYRLGKGDVDGAIENAIDCIRLGFLTRQQPTIISNLVGIAIESIGLNTVNFIVQHGELSRPQCQSMMQSLDSLPESLHCLEVLSESERLMYVDTVTFLARGQKKDIAEMLNSLEILDALGDGNIGGVSRLVSAGAIDWNTVLEEGNNFYDRLIAAGKHTTVRRRRRAWRELNRELERQIKSMSNAGKVVLNLLGGKKSRAEAISSVLLALLAPALEQIMEAETRREARANVTRIGIALAAWRADRKQLPETLTELVPGYLKEIPEDPFVGRSPIYKRLDDGFIVYSVGWDLKDDQGVSFADGEDDVTFRIPMLLED